MTARPVTIRIPEETRSAIEEIARESRRDFSSVANEMLEEAVRMHRIPGVVFRDEGRRREAKVEGTGIGVWEVIEAYQRMDQNWEEFRGYYDWLNEFQLRAALAYWRAYPDEINKMIARNASWTPEKLWAMYPWTKPPEPAEPKHEHAAGG